MNLEVLVSTINKKDLTITEKMNITSDVIIINQCDKNDYIESNLNGRLIRMYYFNERGVGKSRNNALMRSNADICLMADDDMVYVNNYEEVVINAFKNNPNADMIMFNVPIKSKSKNINLKVKKNGRVRFYNALRYGTVNIAFKREAILKANIYFSLLFGGGARYGSGEDSLFITSCLKSGLKIYSNTSIIAEINEGSSTWFTGFNEKYFYDKGALFSAISKKGAYLLAIQFLYRKKHLMENNISFKSALTAMFNGIKDFNKEVKLY